MSKTITALGVFIVLLSCICCVAGLFSDADDGRREFVSVHGQTIMLNGRGLYRNDSVSGASQASGQDVVTLFLGIPLLVIAWNWSRKSFRGLLLWIGTLGYFLYTYMSYSFLLSYNSLFLCYVMLMCASLFALVLSILELGKYDIAECFADPFPSRAIGGMLLFLALAIGFMWLSEILGSLISGIMTEKLEHYTTLVIQAMDLGLILPATITGAVLTLRKNPWGYVIASVMIMKGISLLTAICAMIIVMAFNGVPVNAGEVILFPLFTVMTLAFFVWILKSTKEPQKGIAAHPEFRQQA